MPENGYLYPKTLEDALRALAGTKGLTIIAGGTELMPRIRSGLADPGVLLDITGAGLDYIEIRDNTVIIGATTPITDVETNPRMKEMFPALSEAASEVGGMQTRNLGTVGGNICTGVPSADLAIPLLAYDARLRVQSIDGGRSIPLRGFFLAPRRTGLREGEMVTAIEIDVPDGRWGSAFGKIGRRRAMRLAVVNAAACLRVEGGVLKEVRLSMGNVSPVPMRLPETESFLTGRQFTPGIIEEAARVMEKEISPRDSLRASEEYRREIAPVLLGRTLSGAYSRALAGGS